MDKQTGENVHIYLKNAEDRERCAPVGSHEAYIVLQNDVLHRENRELRDAVRELETGNRELESQSDHQDESIRYSKGLLKNFVEISMLTEQAYDTRTKMLSNTRTEIGHVVRQSTRHLRLSEIMTVAFYILLYLIGCEAPPAMTTVTLVLAIGFSEMLLGGLVLPPCVQLECSLRNTQEQIKKIKDSTDFVSDHIDSL
jgi:hypothetical protein